MRKLHKPVLVLSDTFNIRVTLRVQANGHRIGSRLGPRPHLAKNGFTHFNIFILSTKKGTNTGPGRKHLVGSIKEKCLVTLRHLPPILLVMRVPLTPLIGIKDVPNELAQADKNE